MNKQKKTIFDVDQHQLVSLFDLAKEPADHQWREDELGAILRHQLTAPMQIDLSNQEPGLAPKLRKLTESLDLLLRSFGDLLTHPNPPEELLIITKDFAKACRISPRSSLPSEVASVLYFASIASALVRCGRRISGMTSDDLMDGFRWVLTRSWLDASIRSLIEQALDMLTFNQGDFYE